MNWRCFTFFVLCYCALAQCQRIDSNLLSKKVDQLVEYSLKRQDMQTHLDSLEYTDQELNGKFLLDALATSIGRKFQERTSVARHLQQVVETAYSQDPPEPTKCCKLYSSNLKHDPRFNQKIVSNDVCQQISSSATSNPHHLSTAFRDACVQNLKSLPSLKWQYFGSEEGVVTQFPALPAQECGTFDPRFRPWYVQANVPEPKQVVIVIDKSGSMRAVHNGVTRMNLAIQAAKSVINTLNPYDKFAVIAFSNYAETFRDSSSESSCFSNMLAQATPQNKKKVSDFIDRIVAQGGTNYIPALQKAYEYLEGNQNSYEGNVDRVILFMSDGEPQESSSSILGTQLSFSSRQNTTTVVLLTYGVGSSDFTILRNMAEQTGASETDVKRGIFTAISNPERLRNQMSSYYTFFSKDTRLVEPIWTVPYLDGWGLGIMITASLPVYIGSKLIGVAAVDVTVEELFAEVSYFKPSELSYSFVINEKGLVINHPLFPYVQDHDSLFVSATAFERDEKFLSIFESMKRGESGEKTFVSTRVIANGDSRKYGVTEISVLSTYRWKRIPNTKFSICLVLAVNDTQSVLAPQSPLPKGSFLYHRLDLVPPVTPCRHLNNYCSMNQSSVFLASRAFSDPEYYLSRQFTANDVQAIVNYMEGRGANNQRIKEGIRDEVVASYQSEILWTTQNENTELQEQVIWRYIGTKNGVFRIYPGTLLPNDFDPIIRAWYEHALANEGQNVITPPYIDAASGAKIITMSRVLYEGRLQRDHRPERDDVVAVMGVDILLPYFHTILHQLYPICNESQSSKCLLIDNAGFVIIADEYVSTSSNRTDLHLTELEPEIANALIEDGVLRPVSCSNIEAGLLQQSYQIFNNQTFWSGNTGGYRSCYSFEIVPIANTNTFLIARSRELKYNGCRSSLSTACSCNYINKRRCYSSWVGSFCECPCHSTNPSYMSCQNKYVFASGSSPPCARENKALISINQSPQVVSSLPICYKVSFYANLSGSATTKTNIALYIGIIIGVLVFILILVGISIHLRKGRKRNIRQVPTYPRSNPNNQEMNAISSPPAYASAVQPTPHASQTTFSIQPTCQTLASCPPQEAFSSDRAYSSAQPYPSHESYLPQQLYSPPPTNPWYNKPSLN